MVVNGKLQRLWKEEIVAYLKILPEPGTSKYVGDININIYEYLDSEKLLANQWCQALH
jgi:hypothetical protein